MSWWERVVEGTTHLRLALEAEREVRGWKSMGGFTTGDLTSLAHAPSPENAVTTPEQPGDSHTATSGP